MRKSYSFSVYWLNRDSIGERHMFIMKRRKPRILIADYTTFKTFQTPLKNKRDAILLLAETLKKEGKL